MKRQFSKNEYLDSLGRELVRSTALNHNDIENIVENEDLFAFVRARIVSDRVVQTEVATGFSIAHRVLVAGAAAIVVVAGIFAASVIMDRKNQSPNVVKAPVPAVNEQTRVSDVTKDEPEEYRDFEAPDRLEPKREELRVERAVYRPEPQRRSERKPESVPANNTMEFYALADLHPSEEATRNGRVVRVDLPKASLIALGVNIPLDNEQQVFRTDVLVGPDGVPRAIRMVENF